MRLKAILAIFLLCCLPAMAQTATINGSTTFQTMDGWGGQTYSYANNLTGANADLFFSSTSSSGIGLEIVRTANTFNDTIPDLVTLQSAIARGANVELGLQSPPCTWKHASQDLGESCSGGSTDFGPLAWRDGITGSNGTCFGNGTSLTGSGGWYDQWGNKIVSIIQNYQANSVPITYLSIQNEANIQISSLGECNWSTGAQFQDFIKNYLGPKLSAAGLSSVKVMLDPAYNWFGTDFVSACASDSACNAYVSIYGGHGYGYPYPPSAAPSATNGKHIWMSETGDQAGTYDGSIGNGLTWATNIDGWLQQGITGLEWWELAYTTNPAGGLPNGGLTDQSFTTAKRFYTEGNWSKFVRNGWVRVSATHNPQGGVNVSAFKNPSTSEFAVIAENTNGGSVSQTFALTGGLTASSVAPYLTNSANNLAAQSAVTVSGGSFSYSLPAQSVVTFVRIGGSGTIITANSCNTSDVQYALNLVTSSTTQVNIPAGTCNWTTPINWTVPSGNTNLTIAGASTVSCSGTAGTSSWACTPIDNTIIKDSITSSSNATPFIVNVANTGAFLRITGISFLGGTGIVKNDGMFNVNGQSHSVRVDHIHFEPTTYSTSFSTFSAEVHGDITGVFDHIVCDNGGATTTSNCIGAFNAVGDTVGYGDGTWAQPTGFGGNGFLFIESSQFTGGEAQDCADGGKFVLRYSTIINGSNGSAPIHEHGTKTQGGRGRGCRAYEAYNNYNAGPSPNADALVGAAAGPSLIHHNTLASGRNWFMAWSTTRNDGSATETNTPSGWGYCGTNINSNGVGSAWDGNTNTGSGYPCMDGVGRGQGQAMNGLNWPNALNSVTGSIAWLHQYREPTYVFENSILNGAAGVRINSGGGADTDNNGVYWDAGSGHSGCSSSFNGTCGTGHGPLASRPSTCTAGPGGTYETSPTGSYGVAYFADDNNTLYVCTSTNTWTSVYTPYTYPHPLAGGTPTASTPTFSPGGGTYGSAQSVTISSATGGSTINYTTDGSTPTTSSPTYTSAITIATNTVLQAIANASGYTQSPVGSATYSFSTPTCADPTQNGPNYSGTYFNPPPSGAGYTFPLAIGFTSPTSGCLMHMTLDGSAPTCSSTSYSGQNITVTTVMRVIACQSLYTSSNIIGGTWTVSGSDTLTITQDGSGTGSLSGAGCSLGVSTPSSGDSISCTAAPSGGATVSSAGTGSASACTGASCSFTFSATSTLDYTFTLQVPTPTFLPVAGTYITTQSVAISDTLAGSTICYTVDGSTPTADGAGTCTHGTTYTTAVSVSTSQTIKAIGSKATYSDSAVGSAAYVITTQVATPTFSPVAGSYSTAQSVTISTVTSGSTICFTTDGTTPTADGAGTCTHGTTYSTPVTVASNLTIQAIGSKSGLVDSAVGSAAYTITTLYAPTISGQVTMSGKVTIP